MKQVDLDDKINDDIYTVGPADQKSIAISPTAWNVILIMNIETY